MTVRHFGAEAASYLEVMRADRIPTGSAGLWVVKRGTQSVDVESGGVWYPAGTYTSLMRYTDATMCQGGESVMCDDPVELSRHLEFVFRARGRVLVTGLGLGCVLRGVLANPAVDHVDVVERDADVLKLVAPHLGPGRYAIHHAEAEAWISASEQRWDAAWHDVWVDPDCPNEGGSHLAEKHQRLMFACRRRVGWQGAWHFPRDLRRLLSSAPGFRNVRAWARR